jgi:carboxypeptidase PM20D1
VLLDILKVVLAILALTTVYVVGGRCSSFGGSARPRSNPSPSTTMVAEHLAAAVRCQTVPRDDKGTPDPKAFRQLHQMLAKAYPLVHRTLKREVIGDFSLLYTWPGTRPDLEPVMVMAHQDVVSAEPATLAQWTHPPFDGHISDGVVWGRGTLDIKNQLIGIFEGAEALLRQGYQPERTVLFGLGHDEETGGVNGCKLMGQALQERGIHLAGIVDEGGGIVEGLAAGVRGPVALIGVSEKGYLTTEFSATGQPGHSSTPPPQTAIGILARALARLEAHPMPTHLRRLRPLYHGIGRAAPLYIQVAFANVWLFGPLLKRWLVPIAEMNAACTTTALTIIHGGVEDNTIPAEARAIVNFRAAGDTIAEVLSHARRSSATIAEVRAIEGKFNGPCRCLRTPAGLSRLETVIGRSSTTHPWRRSSCWAARIANTSSRSVARSIALPRW